MRGYHYEQKVFYLHHRAVLPVHLRLRRGPDPLPQPGLLRPGKPFPGPVQGPHAENPALGGVHGEV